MRTLASLGILSEDVDHHFALTPLGEALKTGAPGSARATILALAGDWWWQGWEQFVYCLETGNTGMQKVFTKSVFEYLAKHPQEASYFKVAADGKTRITTQIGKRPRRNRQQHDVLRKAVTHAVHRRGVPAHVTNALSVDKTATGQDQNLGKAP